MTLAVRCILAAVVALCVLVEYTSAFSTATSFAHVQRESRIVRFLSDKPPSVSGSSDDGVVELADEPTEKKEEKSAAPFLSQGEISEEALNMDMSDPKQARVVFYIILALIPVLFLIPLMLGSRELIPQDSLPPVQMS